jgi:hypothetical protein
VKEHIYIRETATIYETDFNYKNRPLLEGEIKVLCDQLFA